MEIFQSPITPPKIIEPEQDQVNAQLGIVLINPTKFHQNPTKGFEETARTKFSMEIFQSPITPPKIIEPEQDQVNAQLGMVLINPTKFHQNPTKGFGETARTKFSMEIFQSPITPPKIIEPEQDYDMHNQAWYLSILQSFIKIRPRVLEKSRRQNFQWKYFKVP